jgi:hypothetical protein
MNRVATEYRLLTCDITRLGRIPVLILTAAALATAQPARPTRISSETAPAGGTAQVKVLLTPTQAASAGAIRLTGARSKVRGAGLFDSEGDLFGTAVLNGGSIDVRFVSPGARFGRSESSPMLTVDFEMAGDTQPGESTPIDLVAADSGEPGGASGRIQAGGSLSIRNVVPGGGMLPAGAVVTLQGMGFRPDTRVKIAGLQDLDVSYISHSELQLTMPAPTRMDGLRITATNPDDAAAEYVAYWRGTPQGESVEPLIARTLPLFSTRTGRSAVLPPQVLTQLNADYVVGLALQNPGLAPADITVALASGGSVRIALPPGARVSRGLDELFGTGAKATAVLVNSSQPIQVLGLLGDRRAGTVLPVVLALE